MGYKMNYIFIIFIYYIVCIIDSIVLKPEQKNPINSNYLLNLMLQHISNIGDHSEIA